MPKQNSSSPYNYRKRIPFPLLLFLGIVLLADLDSIQAETYSLYRFDDLLVKSGGFKPVRDLPRWQTLPNRTENLWGADLFGGGWFSSQKGGSQSDQARFYKTQLKGNPELRLGGENLIGSRFAGMVFFTPLLQWETERHLQRTESNQLSLGEAVFSLAWNSGDFLWRAEGGRGFQRLDALGILYAGFGDFSEIGVQWKPIATSLSLSFTKRDQNQWSGISLVSEKIPMVQNFHLFGYLQTQKGHSVRFGDIQEAQPGILSQYVGGEIISEPLFQWIRFVGGNVWLWSQREMPAFFPGVANHRRYTSAATAYGWGELESGDSKFRIGGLFASKDKISRLDQNSNGFVGIQSDIRAFGGRGSILLNEDWSQKDGYRWTERIDGRVDPENKGIQLLHLSYQKSWKTHTWTAILQSASQEKGQGREAIANWLWNHPEEKGDFFVIGSAAYGIVNPKTERAVLIEEWRISEPNKEFVRFWITSGFRWSWLQ